MSKERRQLPRRIVFEDIIRVAKETALRDGYHVPTLIVDGSRQPAILQIRPLGNTHDERVIQLFTAGVNLALDGRLGQLRQVFMICEGWLSLNERAGEPVVPPSEDPQRKEVLVISGQDIETRKTHMALLEMVRDNQQRLIELKDLAQTGTADAHAESALLDAFVAGYREFRR